MQHLESGSNPKIIFLEFHASFSRLIEDSNFIWIDIKQNWVGIKGLYSGTVLVPCSFHWLLKKKIILKPIYEIEVQYN